MFDRQEVLNELERLFTGEEDNVSLKMISAFWNEDKLNSFRAEHKNKTDEELEVYLEEHLASQFRFMPGDLLKHEINEFWDIYYVYIEVSMRPLGYVNRKEKKVIINTEYNSVFHQFNLCTGRVPECEKLVSEMIDFDKLNEFSVTNTQTIVENRNEMEKRVINRLVENETDFLLSLINEDRANKIDNTLLEEFISERKHKPKSCYTDYLGRVYNSSNQLMTPERVLSEDLIFDFTYNQPFFELMYEELFRKNLLGISKDIQVDDFLAEIYKKEFREKRFNEFEKNYTYLASREIARALSQCGKSAKIKLFGQDETVKIPKARNFRIDCFGELITDGSHYSRNIEQVLFGKKILFDRVEFDKKYGHLK